MIQKIIPLASDSFGIRSTATFIEANDLRILIMPGVSLAPIRYGLKTHPIKWRGSPAYGCLFHGRLSSW